MFKQTHVQQERTPTQPRQHAQSVLLGNICPHQEGQALMPALPVIRGHTPLKPWPLTHPHVSHVRQTRILQEREEMI